MFLEYITWMCFRPQLEGQIPWSKMSWGKKTKWKPEYKLPAMMSPDYIRLFQIMGHLLSEMQGKIGSALCPIVSWIGLPETLPPSDLLTLTIWERVCVPKPTRAEDFEPGPCSHFNKKEEYEGHKIISHNKVSWLHVLSPPYHQTHLKLFLEREINKVNLGSISFYFSFLY